MSVEENKRLAREWYELLGQARYEEARQYCSDDFVFYPMITKKLEGVDTFLALEGAHMDPCPGFTFQILNVIGEGDWVAVHFVYDGYLPDDVDKFHGMDISSRHSHHDVMTWVRFRDGKIVEKRAKYNEYFIYKQLGVPEILALDKKIKLPIK